MENNKQYQNVAGNNFEQEFFTDVRASSENAAKLVDEKKRKHKLIIGIIVVVSALLLIVVTAGITAAVIEWLDEGEDEEAADPFEAETSMMEVMVAPSSAKVLVNGKQYVNGEYEMSPGEYKVVVEKDGFQTYNGTLIVADEHKSYVAVCLQPVDNNKNYYKNNADDSSLCQSIGEFEDISAWDQSALVDDIFEYTPFHDDNNGFYVDPYFDENDEVIVELTFKDCTQTEAVLEKRAYAWMEEQGLEPSKYTFEKTWDCEE